MPEANIIGAFYLDDEGYIRFRYVEDFALHTKLLKESKIKHAWVIMDVPPAPDVLGQLKWFLKDFILDAFKRGALKLEVIKLLEKLKSSVEYIQYLEKVTLEHLAYSVIEDKLDILFEEISKKEEKANEK